MLGIQPHPTVIEIVGYFLYLIPMLLYVLWPPQRPEPGRRSVAAPDGAVRAAPSSVPSPSPATGSDPMTAPRLGALLVALAARRC